MVHFIWHVMTERLFSLPLTKVGIHFGHVKMCATPYPFSWIIFIIDLGPSYTDKLLEFRWVHACLDGSACLVLYPITVDNYAAFFKCTPVGRASDSMMAPT